ncbi:MFS transporter [Microbacterium protaetiae]|uniref:MFS transporter n=1 Tax=Microbacterium protaetiae TaxID=2509458 RepID=A0A4P6EJM1_9MICO|nr:MFS transporter [Microbacterium protaetiae]QAY60307.1 MFS transporter [Microbacterium protaetiae]
MTRLSALTPFGNARFTLYFTGQVVSNTGTWFQNLALSLVVLEATGSAQSLSGVTVAQFLPLLLLGVPAGRLADRLRPRTILLFTSTLSAVVVCGLAAIVSSAQPAIWAVLALVFALGTVNTFDRVAAQAIIFEIVGTSGLSRAVSISTIALAAARSIGPGLAGIAFAVLGPAVCMLLNAASFVIVFMLILLIRPRILHPRPVVDRQDRTGVRAMLRHRSLVTLLVVNSTVALLALNLMLVLTSTVTLTYRADATSVGAVHALNALGAIVGGVLAAVPPTASVRSLAVGCLVLGGALGVSAAAPTLAVFLVLGPVLGLGVGLYQGLLNASAQASVPPEQLGRTMSLVTVGNYGVAPIGAVVMGAVIDATSGRVALAIGGCAALCMAVFVWVRTRARATVTE